MLVAFFFSMLVACQEWPVLIGPYETWDGCASVREWLDRRGYETDDCSTLPLPQDSILLDTLHLPPEVSCS